MLSLPVAGWGLSLTHTASYWIQEEVRAMPVSSLLLTLRNEEELELFARLERFPSVVSARKKGALVALVLETHSEHETRERWEELSALDGVIGLNLVYHNFEDVSEVDL